MRLLILFAGMVMAIMADVKTISVKLVDPITIGKTQTARANFDSLGGAASDEFRRAVFIGRSTYEKLSNGETRVSISWGEVRNGSKSAAVEPFTTRVSTSESTIPAGFSLKARGDTAALTAAVRNMVEGRESAYSSTAGGTGSGESASETVSGGTADGSGWINGASPSSYKSTSTGSTGGSSTGTGSGSYTTPTTSTGSTGGSSTGSGSSTTPTTSTGSTGGSSTGSGSYTTPTTSTGSTGGSSSSSSTVSSSKVCQPIIDLAANTYTITQKNDNGDCVPTSTVSSIYETAKGCPHTIDYSSKLVKIATRKYATPTAAEVQVSPCLNSGKTAALEETFNGCQWVADLDTELAVLQKRFYFQWMGEPVYVTGCVNSDRTAPLEEFKGDRGCQPLIDEQAGTYQETASEKGLCKPTGPIMKIYYDENQCEPFINYDKGEVTLAAIPYVNKNTGKEYVGACERTNTVLALKSTTDGCSAVLDKTNETAIEQIRWYYTLGSVNKYVTGCVNSDVIKPITTYREYNGVCKNLVDFSKMVVQPNYRTMTRLGDKTLEVRGCKYDDNNASLQATYEGCSQRHDFLTNKTYEQERLYYLFDGDRNYVTGCRDSAISYPHYLTTAGCTYTNANNKVIVNKRVAYNQSDGTVGYATSCRPVSDEIKILQEFVGYEHDFVTNQSYRKIRDYFIEPISGGRVYLSPPTRDDRNFPHKEESNGGWTNDDTKLQSTLQLRKYFIDTVSGDKLYPSGTDWTSGLPVPYANRGSATRIITNLGTINSTDITRSTYSYAYKGNILDISIATPVVGSLVNIWENKWQSDGYKQTKCDTYDIGFGTVFYLAETSKTWCDRYNGKAKVALVKEEVDYLRADGSTYSVELRSWYQVQP